MTCSSPEELKKLDDWMEFYRKFWEERFDKMGIYLATIQKEKVKMTNTTTKIKNQIPLEFERKFNAPKELVFDVLTQDEHIVKWSCPNGMIITHSETDLKVGGSYKFIMKPASGGEFEMAVEGVYKQIERANELVYTQGAMSAKGESGDTMITITLEEVDSNTVLKFVQTGFSTQEAADMSLGGWTQAYDKLVTLVHSLTI